MGSFGLTSTRLLCVLFCLVQTPIVALMIPILVSWGRRTSISPKVLLIPLSYASIFGGTTTLIGTSTNLVISGLQAQAYAGTPNATFGFFGEWPNGISHLPPEPGAPFLG
jgi:di/tricarboxylate transporter